MLTEAGHHVECAAGAESLPPPPPPSLSSPSFGELILQKWQIEQCFLQQEGQMHMLCWADRNTGSKADLHL